LTVLLLLEGWPSGLRRTLGKRVYGKPYRGFESHSLRQAWSQRPELSWLFTAMCSVSHFWPQQRCEFDSRDQKCALSAWLPADGGLKLPGCASRTLASR
jgi:hypothetical protein